MRYDTSTYELTYDDRTIAYNPAIATLDMANNSITTISDIYFSNGAALTGENVTGITITVLGDLVPATTDTYSLGTSDNRWKDIWLTGQSINIGAASIGATLAGGSMAQLLIGGDLVPTASLTYSLGTTANRWSEAYIGPGTLDIAGPVGFTASATIGTDAAGIIYTKSGFASPTVIIGPAPGATGAVGGWFLGVTGTPLTAGYDLYAQENLSTVGQGTTGPAYSLVKDVVRSITAGAGITTHSSTAGTTIALTTTGVTSGTYTTPTNLVVNSYGQITSITAGAGVTTYLPVSAFVDIAGTTFDGTTHAFPSTTITTSLSNGTIVTISNIEIDAPNSDISLNMWIEISGGTTFHSSGLTKTSSVKQNTSREVIVIDRWSPAPADTYTVTTKAICNTSGKIVTVSDGHLLVQGNQF